MTKRMIDADSLLKILEQEKKKNSELNHSSFSCYETFNITKSVREDMLEFFCQKINELVKEAQEPVFDKDGWCYDLDACPENQDILVSNSHTFNACKIDGKFYSFSEGFSKTIEKGVVYDEEIFVSTEELKRVHAWRPLPPPAKISK
jgi:hypothetical protein